MLTADRLDFALFGLALLVVIFASL